MNYITAAIVLVYLYLLGLISKISEKLPAKTLKIAVLDNPTVV